MLAWAKLLAAIANAIPELKGLCIWLIQTGKEIRAKVRKANKDEVVNSRIDNILARLR